MNKKILIFAAFCLLTISYAKSNNEKSITINTQNSILEWVATKVTGAHNGTIQILRGSVRLKDDILTGGTFILDMASIVNLDIESEEWNQKLVGHLKSDDFFSVESHPIATLEITKAQFRRSKKATEANYEISGVLTIKSIAKEIVFPARIVQNKQGYEATGKIELDRTRWDIRYGSGKFFDNLGDKMIHDLFTIKFAFKTANHVEESFSGQ